MGGDEEIIKKPEEESFKKPILIGKIGRLPRQISKAITSQIQLDESVNEIEEDITEPVEPVEQNLPISSPAQKLIDNPIPYKEPQWSGLPQSPDKSYKFEVLKNGSIIETIDLMSKPFWIFGRLNNCDIIMQHPTISRYHAVLQYRSERTDNDECGFYLYDLGSTHGTFLNKNKVKSRVYIRIQVGHMLRLGCSTRSYILNGPEKDAEEESALSVTELKQLRLEQLQKREEAEKAALLEKQQRQEALEREREEKGIDWGLGEDADEETDLSENPYAQNTNNEELYLDNPKKALRGFFEREGLELEYDCSEQGIGQFLCKVELPIDDEMGRAIFAEVIHKGKKKDAVVQCALEACRILDRHGVLRQATHESRKRKPKNWEENDYYDSDEDTFLDRTGTIEKKREMRMKTKMPQKAETYDSLMEKEKNIKASIIKTEKDLSEAQRKFNSQSNTVAEQDPLDSYMMELKQSKPDKQTVNKLKSDLTKLRQEHANIVRLINIVRPANLPPLVAETSLPSSSTTAKNKGFPIFGKRKKIKLDLPKKNVDNAPADSASDEEEEDDEEKDKGPKEGEKCIAPVAITEEINQVDQTDIASTSGNDIIPENNESIESPTKFNLMSLKQFEKMLEKQKLPPFADKHRDKLSKIINNLKKLASDGDRMNVDWKMLEAKRRKVMKLIHDMHSEPDEKLRFKVSSELNRIFNELNIMANHKFKVINEVKKMVKTMKQDQTSEEDNDLEMSDDKMESDKKKKKNQRRIQQRQERAEIEKQKGYDEDARKEDYNMWVPPQNQSGDGRTSLNDKYGY